MPRFTIEVSEELIQRANNVFTYGDRKLILTSLVESVIDVLEKNKSKQRMLVHVFSGSGVVLSLDPVLTPILGELDGPITYSSSGSTGTLEGGRDKTDSGDQERET